MQLAKLLRTGGNFLILDEPTNDLDLVTLGVIEQALVDFPGCALVVSHDRWFLDRVATAILAFEGDGKVTLHEGNYSAWLAKRPALDPPPSAQPAARRARPERTGPRRRTFREREELASIEAAILEAESRVAGMERTLQDPAVYRERAPEVPALVAALATARAEVDRLYARWQELEALPP